MLKIVISMEIVYLKNNVVKTHAINLHLTDIQGLRNIYSNQ